MNAVLAYRDHSSEGPCAVCGLATTIAPGLRLLLSDAQPIVCRRCGAKHAAELSALLEVGKLAEQVGRVNHHNRSWPCMEALLKLARACEAYFLSLASREKAA